MADNKIFNLIMILDFDTPTYFVLFLSYTALNKTFMESDGIGQLSRFHCIINYDTQIVSLKKSQSASNIWNFP